MGSILITSGIIWIIFGLHDLSEILSLMPYTEAQLKSLYNAFTYMYIFPGILISIVGVIIKKIDKINEMIKPK